MAEWTRPRGESQQYFVDPTQRGMGQGVPESQLMQAAQERERMQGREMRRRPRRSRQQNRKRMQERKMSRENARHVSTFAGLMSKMMRGDRLPSRVRGYDREGNEIPSQMSSYTDIPESVRKQVDEEYKRAGEEQVLPPIGWDLDPEAPEEYRLTPKERLMHTQLVSFARKQRGADDDAPPMMQRL